MSCSRQARVNLIRRPIRIGTSWSVHISSYNVVRLRRSSLAASSIVKRMGCSPLARSSSLGVDSSEVVSLMLYNWTRRGPTGEIPWKWLAIAVAFTRVTTLERRVGSALRGRAGVGEPVHTPRFREARADGRSFDLVPAGRRSLSRQIFRTIGFCQWRLRFECQDRLAWQLLERRTNLVIQDSAIDALEEPCIRRVTAVIRDLLVGW